MKKPSSYDETQSYGGYEPATAGGHYAIIKQVTEKKSASGYDMIVVLYDFCSPDKQDGKFSKEFMENTKPDKKWPYSGTRWIMVNDYADQSKMNRDFKTFCTSIEKSNNYEISWCEGEAWGKQFAGKRIGVVFGAVENEYNGKVSMRNEPRWFCSWDSVDTAKTPEPKYLRKRTQQASVTDNSFINVEDDGELVIPF